MVCVDLLLRGRLAAAVGSGVLGGGRTLSYLRVRLIYSEWKVGRNQCSICESVKGFGDHEGETGEGGWEMARPVFWQRNGA